jgi:L-alanine-DL-glutamate epimerase-like enolase superfamily enzyme
VGLPSVTFPQQSQYSEWNQGWESAKKIGFKEPELEIKDGHLAIPDRPGFGVELDRKHMAPFLWAECK